MLSGKIAVRISINMYPCFGPVAIAGPDLHRISAQFICNSDMGFFFVFFCSLSIAPKQMKDDRWRRGETICGSPPRVGSGCWASTHMQCAVGWKFIIYWHLDLLFDLDQTYTHTHTHTYTNNPLSIFQLTVASSGLAFRTVAHKSERQKLTRFFH